METIMTIETADQRTTLDATPIDAGLFEFPNFSTLMLDAEVIVKRPSDGVSKSWKFSSLVKRNGGAVTIAETQPSPPNPFASAADKITLSLASITPYSDSTYFGVTITGIDGMELFWSIIFKGRIITTTP